MARVTLSGQTMTFRSARARLHALAEKSCIAKWRAVESRIIRLRIVRREESEDKLSAIARDKRIARENWSTCDVVRVRQSHRFFIYRVLALLSLSTTQRGGEELVVHTFPLTRHERVTRARLFAYLTARVESSRM